MKKLLALVLLLSMVLAIFAGCVKEPAEVAPSASQSVKPSEPTDLAQGKTVAICMGSVNHPAHRVIQYGFLTKAEELGMEPIVSGLDEGTMKELIAKWEDDVKNGVQGVSVLTGDDSAYSMLQGFREQGIHTVTITAIYSYELTKNFIDKNITSDVKTYCYKAAESIVDKLLSSGISGGAIGIVSYYSGIEDMQSSYLQDWFAENTTNFSLNIVHNTQIQFENNGYIDYLNNTEDLVAVFDFKGDACEWSEAANSTGRNDILIVAGNPYNQRILNTLESSKNVYALGTPLYTYGENSAQALYELINGANFSLSESEWAEYIDAPLVSVAGEGLNGIEYYQNILNTSGTYFEE